MEWKLNTEAIRPPNRTLLGNFLSGMETDSCGAGGGGYLPLETSLVEWKRLAMTVPLTIAVPWKLP